MTAIHVISMHVAVNSTAYYAAMHRLAAKKLEQHQESSRLFHSVTRMNEWRSSSTQAASSLSKSEILRFSHEEEMEETENGENKVKWGSRSARLGFAVKPICFCLPGEHLTIRKQLKVLFGTVQVEG